MLDDILRRIRGMGEADKQELSRVVAQATGTRPWIPNVGPQTQAALSLADILLYGGQAAGGKSDALLGLAFTEHRRSLILRRHYNDLGALTERAIQINGSRDGFNGSAPPKLRTADGRLIEFGACARLGDEQNWQGQPHDLIGFDEAVQFLEAQVRFLLGWLRSEDEKQRTRSVLATNPPITADGDWIVGMFRPWLDLTHPSPAQPGELRWFVTDPDGKDFEVPGPAPYQFPGQPRPVTPMSRTFVPAKLSDNPYLVRTDYGAKLDALPEPLRSAVRDGNFMAARADDDRQIIPTQWVIEAQNRWNPDGWRGLMMTAQGLDIGAGRDETVLASRYGGWYAPLETVKGEIAKDPAHAASLVIRHRKHGCPIVVDVGGGFGGASLVLFKENGIECRQFNGAATSAERTKDGALQFVNKRAEAWWRFREELDPGQEGGSAIALPPDPQLRADLTAPTWELKTRGIQVESKEDIKKRLGRSPDRGDAVVMALSEGNKAAVRALRRGGNSGPTRSNVGYAAVKRHRAR